MFLHSVFIVYLYLYIHVFTYLTMVVVVLFNASWILTEKKLLNPERPVKIGLHCVTIRSYYVVLSILFTDKLCFCGLKSDVYFAKL